jgi:hypothetical protein
MHEKHSVMFVHYFSNLTANKMNTPAEWKGNRHMAGYTPYHAGAYISLLLAGTPFSDSSYYL